MMKTWHLLIETQVGDLNFFSEIRLEESWWSKNRLHDIHILAYTHIQISRLKARGRSLEACRSTKILLSSYADRSRCHGRLLGFRKMFPCISNRSRRFGYRNRAECNCFCTILHRISNRIDQFEKDLNSKRGNQ